MRGVLVVLTAAVVTAWLAGVLVSEPPPRRLPLHNAERMEQIVRLGLFPDKPIDMSFVEYFANFTDLNENLTKALERLEYGVLDAENLEIAIKLAEDAKRFKELAAAQSRSARRNEYARQEIFNMQNLSWTWTMARRQKIFQFMQHSMYSTKYEINKLRNLRRKYNGSTVFQMGVIYGNVLEMKTTAGMLFTTLQRMPPKVSMLWYVFHYHKLLNMAYDVASNTEFLYVLNGRIKEGFMHLGQLKGGVVDPYSMPFDSRELTSMQPDDRRRK